MNILLDLRYSLRTLAKSPGFTCAAVLTLALGIGANTAIFSVIDGVLLHPIPFPEPDRLVGLSQAYAHDQRGSISYLNLVDWQRQNKSFEGIAGWMTELLTMSGREQPEQLIGKAISANFFSVLRIQPRLGRGFTDEEDRKGGAAVAMLGEDFWKRRFAGDPNMVGRSLTLNGRPYTVIGIVPAEVRLDRENRSFQNDAFVPLAQQDDPLFFERGIGYGTMGIGRLKSGVTLTQAQADMSAVAASLAETYANADAGTDAKLVSFTREAIGDLEPALLALGAAVGFVLLIACTNIANLALARSVSRSQEFAVRMALGAGRGRLMGQLLTESALLAVVAGGVGLLVASWSIYGALRMLPSALPPIVHVELNSRVLLFSLGVSLLTGILCGFIPALKAGAVGLQQTLRQGGRGAIRGRDRVQHALIVAEVALTLVLLVGAGLMMRSLQNLWTVNPGLNPDGVLIFYTGLSGEHTATPAAIRSAFGEIDQLLSRLPGVEAASVDIGGLPFLGNTTLGYVSEDDPKPDKQRQYRTAQFYAVGPDHFKAMGIPLLRGRPFTAQDDADRPPVVIVDEELARTVFPGQNPLGKHIILGLMDNRPAEIIGIAGHVKHAGLDSDATSPVRSQFYFAYRQLPDSFLPLATSAVACIVRSKTAPAPLMRSIRKELASFDHDRAVHSEELMTDAISDSLARRRFSLMVLGAFAGMALVLAMIGIYGVISYFVSQRTSEIGLRLALGAQRGDILRDVLREGGKLGAIGVVFGLAGAAILTRLMASMLFGISPTDILTFGAAGASLFALTILACYLPARRAVRIDPMVALRCE